MVAARPSRPKLYSYAAPSAERYDDMLAARDEERNRARMSVVGTQKGPYRSALGVRTVRYEGEMGRSVV